MTLQATKGKNLTIIKLGMWPVIRTVKRSINTSRLSPSVLYIK